MSLIGKVHSIISGAVSGVNEVFIRLYKYFVANLCERVRQESVYFTALHKMSAICELADNLHIALLQNSILYCPCHNAKRKHTQFFL